MLSRIRNRYLRFSVAGLLILVCVCFGWWTVNRLVSPLTAVKVRVSRPGDGARKPFAEDLRIATFNIAHGRGTARSNWQTGRTQAHRRRLGQIAELLEEAHLDIVVLNEVDFDSVWTGHVNQARYIAQEAGFPFWAEQRNYDTALPFVSLRWGNAVLSRYPIEEAQLVPFAGFSARETVLAGHKKGLLCTIALTGDRRIRLLAVHLEHRSEATRLQAAERMEEIRKSSELPLVVAGDFNSTPVGFPRATPTADGRTAMSFLLDSGAYRTLPAETPLEGDLTFSTMEPRSVIDWILVPLEWRIASKSVMARPLSDHRAVVMEVQVGGGT